MYFNQLDSIDSEIGQSIKDEMTRQERSLEFIASENFTSLAVMEALGSAMTNKYAEGYPSKRYYGGCEYVDVAETLAIERIKTLFGAEHANVQPHSGSSANFGVYFAMLNPGDTVLGMDLSNGGHLTHGSKVNMSGKYFNFVPYKLNEETETIDFEEVRRIALEVKPKMIVAGASAYPRIIDAEKFKAIADEVGAYLMVDMAHFAGLVATGHHPNPVPFADFVTTTTHKTLRGPRGGAILCKAEYGKKIDSAIFPGIQGGPLMNVIAAKAVCFKEALSQDFIDYQSQVCKNAKILGEGLMANGFRLISNGTDNHLVLVDLRNKNITGKEAEKQLDKAGITTNKNTVLNDPNGPFVTSGIRLGTPAVTTRGFKEADILKSVEAITLVIDHPNSEKHKAEAKKIVEALAEKYPLYKK